MQQRRAAEQMDRECLTLRPNSTVSRQLAKSQGCNQRYVNWQVETPLPCALPPLRGPACRHIAVCEATRPVCAVFTSGRQRFSEGKMSWCQHGTEKQRIRDRGRPAGNLNTFVEQRLMGSISKVHISSLSLRATTAATVSDADAEPQNHFPLVSTRGLLRELHKQQGRS